MFAFTQNVSFHVVQSLTQIPEVFHERVTAEPFPFISVLSNSCHYSGRNHGQMLGSVQLDGGWREEETWGEQGGEKKTGGKGQTVGGHKEMGRE